MRKPAKPHRIIGTPPGKIETYRYYRKKDRAFFHGEITGNLFPFFLNLCCFVPVVLAFYRVRVQDILRSIFPGAARPEWHADYILASIFSDAVASSTMVSALVALWLLAPYMPRLIPALSLGLTAVFTLFMVFATDFFRVYQTAFTKSYLGGEQFTGIKSMLLSAGTEISPVSILFIVLLLSLLSASSLFFLRKSAIIHAQSLARVKRCLMFSLALILTVSLLSAAITRNGKSRSRGEEFGMNPVGALLFGPERSTFIPPEAKGMPAPPQFDSDSIAAPEALRFLPAVKKGRYNVILYFFESTSWRYFDMQPNGEPLLPVMHALARNGLLLKNHYSNYPLSANTMYSVMSSRYSMYGKSSIFSEYADVDVDTIPEVLSRNGYATCLIHTGDLLYAERNKFLADRDIDKLTLYDDLMKTGKFGENVGWGADERLMIDPALAWIRNQNSPYFLMMLPVNPHHPYAVPKDFENIVDPDESGIGIGERTWRNYLNSLHYADAAMGYLVDELERNGLMENTVFIMVGDHGEAFYQHEGNYNHPLFIYEENVHVPAIVYSKKLFPKGLEMDSITRHIDIMPSILDLLAVTDGRKRDGESIFSVSREKMAVFHTSWNDELMGVRDGNWKYIKRMKDSREELYDITQDPGEKTDISALLPAVAERYRNVSDDMVSYMLNQYDDIPRKSVQPRPRVAEGGTQ